MSEQPPSDGDADDQLRLAREIADRFRGSGGADAPSRPRRKRRTSRPAVAGREDAVPLSNVMDELVRQQGWNDQLSNQRVFTHWAEIVGPEVAQHTEVMSFDDGEIIVTTDSTAWATQLRMLAPRIVAKLNDEMGNGSVVRIMVRGPQGPTWKNGKRSIRGARGPRDTYG